MRDMLMQEGISDTKVLDAMEKIDRKIFVPEGQKSLSYENRPLPIGYSQTISQPFIVALMTQLLELKGTERVLEIGTGSGYQSAILSHLCHKVYSVEAIVELSRKAQSLFSNLGYDNILVKSGDGKLGWKEHSPYDRIIVTAAPSSIPQELLSQLKDGGIMVIPVGQRYSTQILWRIFKRNNSIQKESHGYVSFVPMV